MVFFSCNACGDSIKKNQVEKHLFRCRQCTVLSCIDCSKDFKGNEYQTHVTCISEEAKYSGKNFKPKANADKGNQKQEEWMAIIRQTAATVKGKPKLKELLERMAELPNVPRNQKKFENFVKQCLTERNPSLITAAWTLVSKASEDAKKPTNENNLAKPEEPEKETKKPSKRERKEARQKQTKVEKKDAKEALPTPDAEAQSEEGEKSSRKRKRNHEVNGTCTNGHDAENVQADDKKTPKKRRKNKHEVLQTQESQEEEQDTTSPDAAPKPEKFRWAEVVKVLLEAADENELSLKRLKKKVVSEYLSRGYSKPTTKEELEAKLLKRIQKNPEFKLHKERVKLVV